MRTRIKFCGITNSADALVAADLGVDALGLVFYPKSKRYIQPAQAKEILLALPAFVTIVALFLDPDQSEVEAVLEQLPIDLLQFHGRESVAFCEAFKLPYIKAVGMLGGTNLGAMESQYRSAQALLLDNHVNGMAGGTGHAFDWSAVPQTTKQKIILAGGLYPDNVAAAINQVHPYAVDVSSGIESHPGKKDVDAMHEFVKEVNSVN